MSTTPHDSYFKDIFGPGKRHLPSLFSLIDGSLSSRIDISSLQYLSGESITEDLARSTRSDLSASLLLSGARIDGGEARIAFIFEHKSSLPRHIHISLLSLVSALLSRDLREGRKPQPVIPVVLYHGRAPWTLPTRLSEALDVSPEIASRIPDYDLTLIDLSHFSDEALRERIAHPEPLVSLTVMKHIFEPPESVLRHFVRLIKTLSPARDIMLRIVDTTLHYISHAKRNHRPQEIRTIFTSFLAEEKMTTVLDLLKEEGIQEGIQKGIQKGIQEGIQQGIQEGIQKGIQQGVQRGRDETIVRLLQHSALSPQEIAAILGVDLSHVMGLASSTNGSQIPPSPQRTEGEN